eukprot:COSAG06_NODE_2499_length_6756_cov_5.158780_8_plen_67_part_00
MLPPASQQQVATALLGVVPCDTASAATKQVSLRKPTLPTQQLRGCARRVAAVTISQLRSASTGLRG